jgi:Glycosyltransferase family 92
MASTKPAYLSLCAIYRDEAPNLREWIEFHRLVGVERFFMYDNASADDHHAVLGPYMESGLVTLHHWPLEETPQVPAYRHCLAEHGHESRWIAFFDIDEFLFSPSGAPVPRLLAEYEQWPGLGVNAVRFGSSGHRSRPGGLVIESYLHRSDDASLNNIIKSVVDPARVARCGTAHYFFCESGHAVDELKRPIDEGVRWAQSPSFERLRINHYWMKSAEEYGRKWGRVKPDTGKPRRDDFEEFEVLFNRVRDEEILRFLPALRGALGQAEGEPEARALEGSRRGR